MNQARTYRDLTAHELRCFNATDEPRTANEVVEVLPKGRSLTDVYRAMTILMARNLVVRYRVTSEGKARNYYEMTALGESLMGEVGA